MSEEEIETYGDARIASYDNPIPGWLIATYIIMPIIGIVGFALYWNGSHGFLDRGYWRQLQEAANTTMPYINADDPKLKVPKESVKEKL